MAFRDDLEALAAKHDALLHELADKEKEVASSAALLSEARARLHLPVLDHVHVAKPCTADWNQMQGDDRVRTCEQCDKQVYNLSELTRAEAEALLIERAGGLCVRYYRRTDGTILLADCEVGIRRQRRKQRWLIAAAAAGALGSGALVAKHGAEPQQQIVGELSEIATEVPSPGPAPSPAPAPELEAVMGALPPMELSPPLPKHSCPTMPMSEEQVAAQYIRDRRRALGRKLTAAERNELREKARQDVREQLLWHAVCR